jgi:FkbM family methyltransferase
MQGLYLIDDTTIEIDPRSMGMGAGWGVRLSDDMPEARGRGIISAVLAWLYRQNYPVIVDVGAGIGCLSLLPIFHPTVIFHTFEPNPVHVEILRANLALHDIQDRVSVYPVALMDTGGTYTLRVPVNPKSSGCGTLGGHNLQPGMYDGGQVYQVEARTLDSYEFEWVDLIKLDVEGAEKLVLDGAIDTIERCQPAVLFEWSRTSWFDYPWQQIMEFLMEYGYREFRAVTEEDLWAVPCSWQEARRLPCGS